MLWIISLLREPFIKKTITEEVPFVVICMPIHNEEKVIWEKLTSLNQLIYPRDKLKILIGSDCSTDKSNQLIEQFDSWTFAHEIIQFKERQGKPQMVNNLVELSNKTVPEAKIILLTDASVFLSDTTLLKMMELFSDSRVGLVDSKLIGLSKSGNIGASESFYLKWENRIKELESNNFGALAGPFGGCFAFRRNLFKPIPRNFMVDDFFIALIILSQNYACLHCKDALTYEGTSEELAEEIRRKRRIGSGNMQNLAYFKNWLIPPRTLAAWCIFSHKVLRWISPILMLISLIAASIYLLQVNIILFYTLLSFMVLTVMISVLASNNTQILKIPVLRHIIYFVCMNFALLQGFYNYITGIKSNVWQPTKRY